MNAQELMDTATMQFGCVLAARWIGLPLGEAQHFLLGTASLSILGCDPHHPEVPVIALWNEASHEMLDLGTSHRQANPETASDRTMGERRRRDSRRRC